tara:strand:- start:619 stop:1521 length:903 start_codon:yes stop_codon:yes gene_type:complete
MRKVLILTDLVGWHFHQLNKSFEKNKIIVETANLSDITLSIIDNETNILNKGKKIKGITDVFVRHIPSGSLEEVVINLNILKTFKSKGINVVNTAEDIELTVDKSLTSIKLQENNILTPKTWILRDKLSLKNNVENMLKKGHLIYKPLFGSQGDNILKITQLSDLNKIINTSNIYYFQEFLETAPSHDYRVLIIKDRNKMILHSMVRYGTSYINNFSQGGKCFPIKIDSNITQTALDAANAINIPFCGVDIIRHNNKNYVIEINSIPAWKGLQSVTKTNIADQIVSSFLNFQDIKYLSSV